MIERFRSILQRDFTQCLVEDKVDYLVSEDVIGAVTDLYVALRRGVRASDVQLHVGYGRKPKTDLA